MPDSNATYATEIAAILPDNPGGRVRFKLVTDLALTNAPNEVFPYRQTYTLALDTDGRGDLLLPTPDNTGDSTWDWDVWLPGTDAAYTVSVAYSASTQQLADLLVEVALAQPAAASILDGKADTVDGATAGNLAGLDADGNLTDSGIPAVDVVAVDDPTAEQVGRSPIWTGAAWTTGNISVQDYAISSLTAVGLALPPNYECEIPVVLSRQYGGVNDLRGEGVGSTHTIRQDGLYNLSATVYIANAIITGVAVTARIRKNRTLNGESGTLIGWERLNGGALPTHTVTVTATGAYLEAGDTVHLTIQHTHPAPITFGVLRYYIRRDGQVS